MAFCLIISISLTACGEDKSDSEDEPIQTHTVTYDGNGATGGTVPVDSAGYEQGQTVTVLGNTGNLVKAGHSFSGWNTQADGNGTAYTESQTFTMGSSNVILYAEWTPFYSHTITIDGTNDFTANETFASTTSGYSAYVSWDSGNIYVGVSGADISTGNSNKYVLVYIGGTGGTTAGAAYSAQTPTLPFVAKYLVQWRADNSLTKAFGYSAGWSDLGWDFSGKLSQSGSFLEMKIPLSDVGSPASVKLHISLVDDSVGWTYAGVPSTSFTDGDDPDYQKYFDFDLTSINNPASYTPLP